MATELVNLEVEDDGDNFDVEKASTKDSIEDQKSKETSGFKGKFMNFSEYVSKGLFIVDIISTIVFSCGFIIVGILSGMYLQEKQQQQFEQLRMDRVCNGKMTYMIIILFFCTLFCMFTKIFLRFTKAKPLLCRFLSGLYLLINILVLHVQNCGDYELWVRYIWIELSIEFGIIPLLFSIFWFPKDDNQ